MRLLIREADMGAAHSNDLRERVVAEVAAGSSRRGAAARFKVSAASAIRWVELEAQTGGIDPRPRGGKSRSPLEPHAAWLKDLVANEPDLTLAEIEVRLFEGLGLKIGETSIRRFFKRHAISYKKNAARLRADAARRGRGPRALEGQPGRP
jgi:transposase